LDPIIGFMNGLALALDPTNIMYLFIGVMVGNFVGVLPGLGPVTGVALLIPFTYGMEPTSALILLSAIYYGSMYGNSISAVLLNMPGTPAAIMTAMEGYPLARQGRAGPALAMAAFASFFAGTVGAAGLLFLTPTLSQFALRLGPPEEFALFLAAFTLVATLSGSFVKGVAMTTLGVTLATIGPEPMVAASRMTFGSPLFEVGLNFVAASIGLFAIPSAIEAMERPTKYVLHRASLRMRDLLPTRKDLRESATAFPLGSVIGFFGSVMPGIGPTESSLMAYALQKRFSRRPELYGKGSMEGLTSVEAANNASSVGGMIPMLSFGIPSSATTAVLMGAMLIHGLQPGPMLMAVNPNVVFAVIASMYLGNLMLLLLNLPLIRIWVACLRLPQNLIVSGVVVLSATGVYAAANSVNAVLVMFGFGILGYILNKLRFPVAPIILALILTGPLEAALGKSLAMSGGDWSIFVSRPIAMSLIALAALSVLLQLPILRWIRSRRTGRASRG
jgi:putative tricarboxylic transport membrane protein